jgi:hypothetical protein
VQALSIAPFRVLLEAKSTSIDARPAGFNVLLAFHQIATLNNLFSYASLWSRSIRHITNFNITGQTISRRGTMRVVGEKSFLIHSARTIVVIEHEKAAPMRHHFDLPREP